MAYSSFFYEERDCSLTQRRRRRPGRGDALGDPFKEDPNAPRPCYRRPGKEVPPERARTNHKKKGRSALRECLRKTRKPASDSMERICLPLPGSPCQCRRAWRENTKGKIYRNRLIDRQKATAHETAGHEFVRTPAKLLWRKAVTSRREQNALTETNSHRQRPKIFTAAPRQLPSPSCHPASRGTRFGVTRLLGSAKDISQTSFGFTHWILSGIRGGFSNGDLSVKSGFMRSSASLNPRSPNPLPE